MSYDHFPQGITNAVTAVAGFGTGLLVVIIAGPLVSLAPVRWDGKRKGRDVTRFHCIPSRSLFLVSHPHK